MSALVRRRTKALTQALSREIELKKATDIANDKLQSMSRVLIISQLGSLIAHEIRQPLAAIDAYAHGTLRFLEEGKMDSASVSQVMQLIQRQAAKAEEIVDRVRSYAKAKQVPKAAVNLSMCVRRLAQASLKTANMQQCGLKPVFLQTNLSKSWHPKWKYGLLSTI